MWAPAKGASRCPIKIHSLTLARGAGANREVSTGEGFKPLHLAAQGGHVEVVKVLNPEP